MPSGAGFPSGAGTGDKTVEGETVGNAGVPLPPHAAAQCTRRMAPLRLRRVETAFTKFNVLASDPARSATNSATNAAGFDWRRCPEEDRARMTAIGSLSGLAVQRAP